MIKQAKHILKETFGYDEFRPMQEDVISNVLAGSDTLAIMPTGSGKSLCYQIPALIFDGLTIVVSPLISLMQDQITQLEELGINAVVLNSAISYDEYQDNISKIKSKQAKLLYIAPESLVKDSVIKLLKKVKVSCLTIDEAHCISEWGHDFRPEYRMLIEIRRKFSDAVVIALTATATPRVQEDIGQSLGFNQSNIFISSFNRENLMLHVKDKVNALEQTITFLNQFPNQSGIIYCFSRKQVDALASELKHHGFSVRPYHAGLAENKRKKNQDLFIKDDVQIIVATIAFGMGINKPNVRFVIHHDLPKNIESYYQEIGRAGRDGVKAECLLLFSYGDISKIKYFINQKQEKEKLIANKQLNSLVSLATAQDCRRLSLLSYFGEQYTIENCGMCDNCLGEKKEKQDLTIPAQQLLSCIKQTREFYGITHIIDVLRGSNSKKVVTGAHNKLSTHGIGREFTKKEWLDICQQLINNGFIKKEDKYGSLKFTKKSKEIYSENVEFRGVLNRSEESFGSYQTQDVDYDLDLFDILRRKRKDFADEHNVPPYIIFSDKSLVEMSTFFPQSNDSMLNINGVGALKMQKYGDAFLELICEYAEDNNIEEKRKIENRKVTKIKSIKTKQNKLRKYIIIGRQYNEGMSLQEIQELYNIKLATVLDNLFKYVESGEKIKEEGLLEDSLLSLEEIENVITVFKNKGCKFLKPAFQALNGKVTYEELQHIRLYYMVTSEK
jgi:ATP-dependent DNA helicase RecQ